ncbi:LAME_0F13014g1_1 [Lachancea meyersii CBS 8951]|uniref:LAME_0F13014g1_1 n=1 Tax=Lachancea meyersii CBS 8951 TaxID=1266667 RepID=A0A1G4JX72_9SACH|nr:LAME_0F13014g1_1 [Lachancea meyersii CBS 8951]
MGNSLDVDVEVDWLYKGKRRPKTQMQTVRRERSSSVSNGSLGHLASKAEPEVAVANKQAQQQTQQQAQKQAQQAQQAQQTSVAKQTTSAREKQHTGTPAASFLQRSSSVHETGTKSKKSLFSSLFSRNTQSSSDRPAIAIPLPKIRPNSGPVPINTNAHATSHEAMPSMKAAVSQFLKEPSSPEVRDTAPIHEERVVLNRNPHRKSIPIESLSNLPLRRVTFAVDRFGMDPPQQIPSRKPKKGDVLVPQDMICPTPSISVGITNTQGSVEQAASPLNEHSKEYKLAMEYHRRALKESDKHQQEAHYAARRIAHEVQNFKAKNTATPSGAHNSGSSSIGGGTTNDVSGAAAVTATSIDDRIKNLEIDKPIHKHENFFDSGSQNSSSGPEKLTLDKTYTRCCHLREILPIPSTLKQVKDKSAPLQTLKFLNPRPTLIDILSFCDFIAITPVHNVIFDNVNLTQEMLKIVISSLVNSTAVEKLGLRNVTFNHDSWKLLCKFLLKNKSLLKLDISHTKVKPDLPKGLYRANMDWNLFIDVLQRRKEKPLDELLVNGVKFDNIETFTNLLNTFASLGSPGRKRLGIAQSDITGEQIKFLMSWISDNSIDGVDLGFNDLSELVKPLVGKLTTLSLGNMHYFTLNGTNIATAYDAALILRALSKLPNLYFLDLSNLPQIFPDIFPYLNKYLPRMANLKRLHLDSNEFSSRDVVMVTTVLSKCKELLHLSLLNLSPDAFTTGMSANVYDCVRQCAKLTNLDIAYGNMPEEISSRIALCLMRRMHRDFELDDLTSQDDLLFDGTLLSETAENIFEKLNNFEDVETDTTRRYLLKKYWERFNRVHDNVQRTIDEMFEKRAAGELNFQSKENLLRLLFLENNLSHILSILKTYPQVANIAGLESSTKQATSENDVTHLPDVEAPTHVRPHLMATDSGTTIDLTTGKAVLVKQPSHVALVSKKQEEEEGEFHKWGFFVQQQNSIYPDHQARPTFDELVEKRPESASSTESPRSSQPSTATQTSHSLIAKIPSGMELRDAVMRAKGIDSIEELIDNVSGNRVTLDKIYGVPLHPMAHLGSETSANRRTAPLSQLLRSTSNASVTSSESGNEEKVDETYDKLLNSLSKVRSNK